MNMLESKIIGLQKTTNTLYVVGSSIELMENGSFIIDNEIPVSEIFITKNMSIYHVTPMNDLKDHSSNTETPCWCNPNIKTENGDLIIIHNSADGREGVEMAKEILK